MTCVFKTTDRLLFINYLFVCLFLDLLVLPVLHMRVQRKREKNVLNLVSDANLKNTFPIATAIATDREHHRER